MKALIIIAGKSSRFRSLIKSGYKPLAQLLGLSLIERVILTAKQAGIDEFIIVIGYLGEKIKKKLGDGNRYAVKITYVENKDWQRANGYSVLKAKEMLKERFILLMGDHIFDPKILKELKKTESKEGESILVVDQKPKEYIDLDDATKVKIENGHIVDIGKKIEDYDAVDCGIFLLSPSIFEAIEESAKGGDETLSGGIRVLARGGKMRPMDLKDHFWMDIDTRENLQKAERLLCEKLSKPTDGPVSKFLNRPLSIPISKLLVKTRINPNTISFFSFLLCLLSAFFFSLGHYLPIVIGGLLSQFSSVMDGSDGEVARLKFQQSDYGAWWDRFLDRYADVFLILGMTFGLWSLHNRVEVWIVGLIALVGSFMSSYTAIPYDLVLTRGKKKVNLRFGRDIRLFLILIGALTNQIFYTLILLGILTNVVALRRIYILRNVQLSGDYS